MELFSRSRLKVISAVSTNLFAAWFLSTFVSKSLFDLTVHVATAILSLGVALYAEKLLEKYEQHL